VYVRGFPSTSVEPLPFRVTREPTPTVCLGPATAIGGEFTVLTLTVAVSDPFAFVTVRLMTYIPGTSIANDVITAAGLDNVAVDPAGVLVNVQLYVSVPVLLGLVEALPFKVTVLPTVAV
jgi:hypothetical protein